MMSLTATSRTRGVELEASKVAKLLTNKLHFVSARSWRWYVSLDFA